jgi:hypothetical protein
MYHWETRVCRRHVCLSKIGRFDWSDQARQGTKLRLLVDGAGLPLALDVDGASPAEVTLIEPLLDRAVMPYVTSPLVSDGAADSDPLATRDVALVCLIAKTRSPRHPGWPTARPYRKRWIIQRSIGWIQAFLRLVTRYEFYWCLFHSFAKLACLMIVLRRFWNRHRPQDARCRQGFS